MLHYVLSTGTLSVVVSTGGKMINEMSYKILSTFVLSSLTNEVGGEGRPTDGRNDGRKLIRALACTKNLLPLLPHHYCLFYEDRFMMDCF